MTRFTQTVVTAIALLSATAPAFSATGSVWPGIPKKFVTGRPATSQDMKAGRAVFLLMPEDRSGQAASVKVPQYAFWTNEGRKRPAVVVQAEKARDGSESVALLMLDGQVNIVDVRDVKLLGTKKPKP